MLCSDSAYYVQSCFCTRLHIYPRGGVTAGGVMGVYGQSTLSQNLNYDGPKNIPATQAPLHNSVCSENYN